MTGAARYDAVVAITASATYRCHRRGAVRVMIRITCPNCGREHEIGPALAGLVLLCKGCSARLPSAAPAAAPPPAPAPPSPAAPDPDRVPTPPFAPPARPIVPDIPAWLRHAHWLLALALLPLAFTLLRPDGDEETRLARLLKALDDLPPEERKRVVGIATATEDGEFAMDLLFDALQGHKLPGALLPRDTWLHWALGAGAGALFLGFIALLAARGAADSRHLTAVALFTATIGIGLLLFFQWLADRSQGVWLTGRGLIVILFYVVKFIGYSYRAALDPENGFFQSFVGYTCGVGLCEEVVKALPLLWYYRRPGDEGWRGAFVWGLASGAGFGIAEGVIYAHGHYNGFSGPDAYLVRFVSCVALHAMWTGTAGVTLYQRQDSIQEATAWYEFILPVLRIVFVPMVLHGLYDTLLKKEINAGALAVAVLSFLYLAYQIGRAQGDEGRAYPTKP